MLQKKWFKTFIWFSASAFFFLGAAVVISYFNPNPGEKEIMNYMSGMMSAMDGSTMGFTMSLENDKSLNYIISMSAKITIPLIVLALLSGLIVRIRRTKFDK
jgi:hypothetical protein